MENKFTSFVLDEERSTYTEGESKSRRSSILKPPKVRAPLQEVNLGGSADDTEDFDTLRKRRVSFAGVNSVKEFCSQAESLQVCHIQSYEETFSTSSDNSHNSSAAKSVQLGTPKNAVPLGGDHNFADDPMDLTDSAIDNNAVPNKVVLPVIHVLPVVTPSALSESALVSKANLHARSDRKSVVFSNPRSMVSDCSISSNMSISSIVGTPAQKTPRNPDPPVAMTSPWSCSMEITEPIPQNIPYSKGQLHQEQVPHLPYRNSIKLPEQSDSGMELTEAVKIRPFPLNQANDDFGNMSMEVTEVIKKTELKSFHSQISCTNFTTNKSASMDFTEVIQRKDSHSRKLQYSSAENSRGNSGMEFTVGENYVRSEPSELVPLAQHNINPSEKSYSAPPVHHVTPFPHGVAPDCEESILQTSGNQSVSDMDITGVHSLSKYSKLVQDNDDVDDMDFTHLMSINGPTSKKARLSNEPDELPFQITSPLSNKFTDADPPSSQMRALTTEKLTPSPVGKVSQSDPHVANGDKPNPGINSADDDEDTFALNFKNINQGNSPIELSILNEFKDSPTTDKPTGRESVGHDLTMNASVDLLEHEHLLLYSPPKDTKPHRVEGETKVATGFGRLSMPTESLNQRKGTDQPIPVTQLNSLNKCSESSFEAKMLNEKPNVDANGIVEPLRNVEGTCSFVDEPLQTRARVSFKDFEIKPDTIIANEGISAMGLDDSDILKAGLDDMTCPEQVPSVCMSMTSNIASPCSKSRMSFADKTTFSNSVAREVGVTRIQSIHQGFSGNLGNVGAQENLSKTINGQDNQDTSVSAPFVFKSLPDKIKSDPKKLNQSIPVIGFDESRSHQTCQPKEDSGACIQKNSEGLAIFPLARKSLGPNQLMSSQEMNDQDTTHSMPFVFKVVTGKSSDAPPMRQSFPIIEFGEAQSSAQMELTDVTLPNKIESRKSIAHVSFAPEGRTRQPSYTSGQIELKDDVAVNCKSVHSSSQIVSISPQDPSGIDETLMTIELPKKDIGSEVVCLQAMVSVDGSKTMSNDMEETNIKSKDLEQRKSFFPLDQSPFSLSNEETIAKPNVSDVCVQQTRQSCFDIDNEETFAKSSFSSHVQSQKKPSPGTPDIDMEQTAFNPQISLSSAPRSRKSNFEFEVNLGTTARSSSNNLEISMHDSIKGSGAINMVDMEQTKMNSEMNLSLSPKNRKSFFSLQTSPRDVITDDKGALAKSSEERTSSDALGNMDVDQSSLNPKMRKSLFDPQPLPKSTTDAGRLSSLNQQNSAADSVMNETLQLDPVHTQDMNDVDLHLDDSGKTHERAGTDLNKCNGLFSDVEKHHDDFPPSRLSRKSAFGITNEAQLDNDELNEKMNNEEDIQEVIVEESENPSSDNHAIGERPDYIVTSSMPFPKKEQDSGCYSEQNDEDAGKILTRKSVRFVDAGTEEPCVGTHQSDSAEIDEELSDCYTHKNFDNSNPAPKRASRKSCIGVTLNMSTDEAEICDVKANLENGSDELEFAIRRNKRKSTIGTRLSENYPDIMSRNLEECYKIDVTPLDGQQYESEMQTGPEFESAAEPQEVANDVDLSKDMMNISLNDEELSDSELEKLHTTSTPCKPRSSCADSQWDRKRNRSGTAKTPSSASNVALDLSQEMMNISIQGDERSPLPKKLSIHSTRNSSAAKTPTLTMAHDGHKKTNEPIESSVEVLRSPLLEKLSIQPLTEPSTNYKHLKEDSSCRTQSNMKLALSESVYVFEDGRPPEPMLPYETRAKNRDLMRRCGFNMRAAQTNWETSLFEKVLGVRVVLPFCEFNEQTKIESIQYTFHHWMVGQTIRLHRETVAFVKKRIHRKMPEVWLQEQCNTIRELNRVLPSLRSDIDKLKPLINQLHYVKCRLPCTLSDDSISFAVVNNDIGAHFKITIELKNSHKMSDCVITVKNIIGKVNLDAVRLVFSALPSNDEDVLFRFVKYLSSETVTSAIFESLPPSS